MGCLHKHVVLGWTVVLKVIKIVHPIQPYLSVKDDGLRATLDSAQWTAPSSADNVNTKVNEFGN